MRSPGCFSWTRRTPPPAECLLLPAIMEDTLATPRFARYHQAMESADRLITEAMSADKNFELQLLQIQQQLDVTLTS